MYRISRLTMVITFLLLIGISNGTKSYFVTLPVATADTFMMPIEDMFSISGRGTVMTGTVVRGNIKKGDTIEIIGSPIVVFKTKVRDVIIDAKTVAEAHKDDKIGILVSGIDPVQVHRGMVAAAPGSLQAHYEFTCTLHMFTKDEGGRSTPVFDKYMPQFVFWTNSVTGEVTLPNGTESLTPGQEATVSVKLSQHAAIEKDMEFTIREGGRTVGKGRLIKIIN